MHLLMKYATEKSRRYRMYRKTQSFVSGMMQKWIVGGHSGYIDCYPETNPNELYYALLVVGNKDIADNYRKALDEGENDGWESTDSRYYCFSPSLCEYLEDYVEKHKDEIFQ